jgi:hypothetical protein
MSEVICQMLRDVRNVSQKTVVSEERRYRNHTTLTTLVIVSRYIRSEIAHATAQSCRYASAMCPLLTMDAQENKAKSGRRERSRRGGQGNL